MIPGVNPIEFSNLEDYTKFIQWQTNVGIKCPVLYVQNTYDTQGNRVYKVRPNVCDLQGGLPPTPPSITPTQITNTTLINSGLPILSTRYDDISKLKEDIEKNNENNEKMEKIYASQKIEFPGSLAPVPIPNYKTKTDDPMDPNWGGQSYTEKSIADGKYEENEVLFY